MAVPEQTPYIEHTGNGVTTSFALKFQCESKDHLIVLVDEIEPPIATWSLIGGNVVFTTAPAAGKKIKLQRNTPFGRTTNYQSFNNSFRPQTVNIDFDRIWWKLQELGVADWLMKLYVDRLHQQQEQKINDLKGYVDDRDDELRAYLLEEIRKQGVALDQLDEYYNYLMQRLAQIAVDKGWEASFVVDASGKNQQEINNNTAYFYRTVTEMVADVKLTDGVIVGTKGYHNIFDDGGAIYLISAVGTDYSIPLSNGLHAVFRDTFDIRKFGIVSSATLDQTENLRRMISYADSREYEIDFHNYEIMTPDIVQYTSSRGTIFKGMGFNYPHKIKNVKPVNNKSIPIYQGTIPIQFLPKNKGNGETFELENVRFDLYVVEQTFISGEGDGRFHGFYAGWHPDYPVTWPTNMRSECGYKFKANSIYVDTPAVTSTMALNLWFSDIDFKDMFGDYIAYYTTHFGTRVTAENCHGVYRDDLHASGRLLVTNFFQEEPEVGSNFPVYYQEFQRFNKISCYKKSTGAVHAAIKRQQMGDPTIGELSCTDVIGTITWSQSIPVRTHYEKMSFTRCDGVRVIYPSFGTADFYDCDATSYIDTVSTITEKVFSFHDCRVGAIFYTDTNIDLVNFNRCTFVAPLIRNRSARIKTVNIVGGESLTGRMFECDFETINASGGFKVNVQDNLSTLFYKRLHATEPLNNIATLNVSHASIIKSYGLFAGVDSADVSVAGLNINIKLSDFDTFPTVRTGLGVFSYQKSIPDITGSKTVNPPPIDPNGTYQETITVNGAVVGQPVLATFSLYNAGIKIDAAVSANNTVTVEFRNTSAAPIDLGSGTLAVKLI